MDQARSYWLRFRSPLHIGERGVGQEETQRHVPADTLFSAICSVWRLLYGAESLYADLVAGYECAAGRPPLLLSSAFPYAGGVRFFPRPATYAGTKALRRVPVVSERLFEALICDPDADLDEPLLVNDGRAAITKEEEVELADFADFAAGERAYRLWGTSVVPRVTLDRVSLASQIWQFGELSFAEGCGLWFAAVLDQGRGDSLKARFEACLRLLGDSGIGGERGAGRGVFEVAQIRDTRLPGCDGGRRFLTLSPFCPPPEAVGSLISGDSAYDISVRRGWIGSPEGSNLRRRTVWMFREGSVFPLASADPPGRLVDVTPDPSPHAVWRYGYAFPLTVR